MIKTRGILWAAALIGLAGLFVFGYTAYYSTHGDRSVPGSVPTVVSEDFGGGSNDDLPGPTVVRVRLFDRIGYRGQWDLKRDADFLEADFKALEKSLTKRYPDSVLIVSPSQSEPAGAIVLDLFYGGARPVEWNGG